MVYGHTPNKIFDRFFLSAISILSVTVVGFDYDYTLVTYNDDLLSLIYDMALQRLVDNCQYPIEMLSDLKGKFDPNFSIRGLAVDRETGWICHLSYTHKTAVAWEGREKVSIDQILKEYGGKRALRPSTRRKRLKPLNDLFSMAECCLMADTVQWFKDNGIPFFPRAVVTDVLNSIGGAHISGDFHRIVAGNPEKYFVPQPYLKDVLDSLKNSGKKLIFVRWVSHLSYSYDASQSYYVNLLKANETVGLQQFTILVCGCRDEACHWTKLERDMGRGHSQRRKAQFLH